MIEFEYKEGPRILPDGTNMDKDFQGAIPKNVQNRQITDPVSDGSLGPPGYEPGQKNLDGSDL